MKRIFITIILTLMFIPFLVNASVVPGKFDVSDVIYIGDQYTSITKGTKTFKIDSANHIVFYTGESANEKSGWIKYYMGNEVARGTYDNYKFMSAYWYNTYDTVTADEFKDYYYIRARINNTNNTVLLLIKKSNLEIVNVYNDYYVKFNDKNYLYSECLPNDKDVENYCKYDIVNDNLVLIEKNLTSSQTTEIEKNLNREYNHIIEPYVSNIEQLIKDGILEAGYDYKVDHNIKYDRSFKGYDYASGYVLYKKGNEEIYKFYILILQNNRVINKIVSDDFDSRIGFYSQYDFIDDGHFVYIEENSLFNHTVYPSAVEGFTTKYSIYNLDGTFVERHDVLEDFGYTQESIKEKYYKNATLSEFAGIHIVDYFFENGRLAFKLDMVDTQKRPSSKGHEVITDYHYDFANVTYEPKEEPTTTTSTKIVKGVEENPETGVRSIVATVIISLILLSLGYIHVYKKDLFKRI